LFFSKGEWVYEEHEEKVPRDRVGQLVRAWGLLESTNKFCGVIGEMYPELQEQAERVGQL